MMQNIQIFYGGPVMFIVTCLSYDLSVKYETSRLVGNIEIVKLQILSW